MSALMVREDLIGVCAYWTSKSALYNDNANQLSENAIFDRQ